MNEIRQLVSKLDIQMICRVYVLRILVLYRHHDETRDVSGMP